MSETTETAAKEWLADFYCYDTGRGEILRVGYHPNGLRGNLTDFECVSISIGQHEVVLSLIELRQVNETLARLKAKMNVS